MKNIVEKVCSDRIEKIRMQSSEDIQGNKIYGKILEILNEEPKINLDQLIDKINKGKEKFTHNAIRNRRGKINEVSKTIAEAKEVYEKIKDYQNVTLEEYHDLFKGNDIFRNKLILKYLIDDNKTPIAEELYYSVRNEQCKGIILEIIEGVC